jgi:PAS domain S-box-containing protein
MIQDNASRQHSDGGAELGSLTAVLDGLRVGIVVSGPHASARAWNRAALKLLGLTAAQLRGDTPADPRRSVVHEDGSEFRLETQPLAVALATGKPVHDIVMGVFQPFSGQRLWLLVNADPSHDDRGEVAQVVCTYCDISERRGFVARLAVSDRLAAMATLASGVAHEINNPLAYITANLAYAHAELGDPAALTDDARITEIRHAISEARDGAGRVTSIVSDLRSLARCQIPRQPISVVRVLESALGAMDSELRPRANLVRRFLTVPLVDADEARLGQVFINLLLNAADAVADGPPGQSEIQIATSVSEQGHAVVEVRDSGVGIPPDLHQKIFDPFYTGKPVGRGKGLGLAICHHIVTELGGTISVESAPERGSAFRVTLPPAPAAATDEATRSRQSG